MKRILSVATFALVSLAIVTTPVAADESLTCPICDASITTTYEGDLSTDEVDGLLLALNDEYHAWAVYDQVLQDFGEVRPFSRIIDSEARHIDELVELFEAYGVTVPENPWIGNVPSFASVQEAAQAGVDAEIANATLYDELFASTDREEIEHVYTSLQAASDNNHLTAFQRAASADRLGRGAGRSTDVDATTRGGRGARW